jgi:Protein of unknown function (DUF2845)
MQVKEMNHYYGVMLLFCCFFSQQLLALRCSNWLVERGDSIDDIYDVCGEPEDARSYTTTRHSDSRVTTHFGFANSIVGVSNNPIWIEQTNHQSEEVHIDKLTYFFHKGGIPKSTVFTFENGCLTMIYQASKRGRRGRRW